MQVSTLSRYMREESQYSHWKTQVRLFLNFINHSFHKSVLNICWLQVGKFVYSNVSKNLKRCHCFKLAHKFLDYFIFGPRRIFTSAFCVRWPLLKHSVANGQRLSSIAADKPLNLKETSRAWLEPRSFDTNIPYPWHKHTYPWYSYLTPNSETASI